MLRKVTRNDEHDNVRKAMICEKKKNVFAEGITRLSNGENFNVLNLFSIQVATIKQVCAYQQSMTTQVLNRSC